MNENIKYKYAELFCGAGGMSLGASNAVVNGNAIVPIWALDYSKEACETYAHNIGKHVHFMDAKSLDPESVPDHDGLGFGFPCNDFSNVGEKKGTSGKFGSLYKVCSSILDAKKPTWFVAENVDGLSSSNGKRALPLILESFSNAGDGYSICAHMYKLENYGIPQTRHRIFIVGIRSSLGITFKPPAPSLKVMTASECINNPPIPGWAKNQELTRQSPIVVDRLRHIPPGKNAWCDELPMHLRLNVKGAKLSQIYKRLDPNKPSYTITASGGGGTHVYHWDEPRALTNRERARLQTFPDNFTFFGSNEKVRKQIGMAVPPMASRLIFEALLKTLSGIDYECVSPNLI